jgi:acyl-CoA synthetase (AMP-forming)/AMP-acid ligase II
MSLWGKLTDGVAEGRGTLHCWVGDRVESSRWREVTRDAEEMTAGLRNAGVEPGARVATVLLNTPHAVRGILGTWLAGGVIASFPVPARGMGMEEYLDQIAALCAHLEPAALLLDEPMLQMLPAELRESVNAHSWESTAGSGRVEPAPPEEDDVSFIQYSSGSTSLPKGCMLSARSIERQIELILEMIEADPYSDSNVSWLPLSHDMGLFGNLLTLWLADADLVLSTPERFMMAPRTWFGDVADSGATYTCGTPTALALAARAQRGARAKAPLNLHTVILGAERLEWEVVTRAVEAFGPQGLRAETLMPAYGLAEATLAVTATPRREEPRHLVVDGVALADGEVVEVDPGDATATRIVSGGRPITDVELPGLEEGELSEIRVRSACLSMGYYGEEERTRERFRDGEFLTGDLGFERDGHLYPVGRTDDLISIGGRNVYAREIEAAVDALDGVRRGCSTIVERRDGGRQRLAMLIELKDGVGDHEAVAEEAAALAMSKAAVAIDQCLFLEKGRLPKTPTGKIQRYRCKQLLDLDRLQPLETVELVGA